MAAAHQTAIRALCRLEHNDCDYPACKCSPSMIEEYRQQARAVLGIPERFCGANVTADPPQDCDAPFCGCNPEWEYCIGLLRERGWEPQSANAAYERVVLAELRAALKPFVAFAKWGDEDQLTVRAPGESAIEPGMLANFPDDYVLVRPDPTCPGITLGNLRAARKAFDKATKQQ